MTAKESIMKRILPLAILALLLASCAQPNHHLPKVLANQGVTLPRGPTCAGPPPAMSAITVNLVHAAVLDPGCWSVPAGQPFSVVIDNVLQESSMGRVCP